MPLPMMLNHINIWAHRGRRRLGRGGHGHAHRRDAGRLAPAVRQRHRRQEPEPHLRHPHAPRPRGHGRLADAQVQRAAVDDAAGIPELPRAHRRHRPRGARRRRGLLPPRRLDRCGDRELPRALRQLRQAHPCAARQLPAHQRRRGAAHRRARLEGHRRHRPFARTCLPVLPRAEAADQRRPGAAAHLVQRVGAPDRARRRPDARLDGVAGQAQARGARRRAGAAGAQRMLPRPACAAGLPGRVAAARHRAAEQVAERTETRHRRLRRAVRARHRRRRHRPAEPGHRRKPGLPELPDAPRRGAAHDRRATAWPGTRPSDSRSPAHGHFASPPKRPPSATRCAPS